MYQYKRIVPINQQRLMKMVLTQRELDQQNVTKKRETASIRLSCWDKMVISGGFVCIPSRAVYRA
jgi:hypothetical protein